MNDQLLLKEYVSTVVAELKLNTKFIAQLKRHMAPSLASNGRTAAVFWIRKTEEINDEPLPDNVRREIIDFASSKYAKLFRKHNNDFKETDSALVGLINAKFGYLREI